MPTIIVSLQDIPTDPEDDIDLTALSSQEVVEHVRKIYEFLPDTVDISVAKRR